MMYWIWLSPCGWIPPFAQCPAVQIASYHSVCEAGLPGSRGCPSRKAVSLTKCSHRASQQSRSTGVSVLSRPWKVSRLGWLEAVDSQRVDGAGRGLQGPVHGPHSLVWVPHAHRAPHLWFWTRLAMPSVTRCTQKPLHFDLTLVSAVGEIQLKRKSLANSENLSTKVEEKESHVIIG